MRVLKKDMRNILPYTVLACAALTCPSCADDNEINWLGSYRDAVQQARQSQKPILVEFRCEA